MSEQKTTIPERADRCHFSRTGWARWVLFDGAWCCTCEPRKAPLTAEAVSRAE